MGLKEGFQTLREIYRNRFSNKPFFTERHLSEQEKSWVQQIKKHGVCKIENFLTPEQCDDIVKSIESCLTDFTENFAQYESIPTSKFGRQMPKGYGIWNDKANADYRIFHAEKLNETIQWFNSNPHLLDVGSSYLQSDLIVRFTMANRLQWKDGNLGSGGGWHRDMTFRRGFKAMIYLSDVDEECGPFQYIPLSGDVNWHLKKLKKVGQYQFTHDEIMNLIDNNESKIVTATAKKGSLLLFETNLLHRGKPISAGKTRYAITNYHNF